jgi:BirA family biotin operon repressor/biotin-[acetyl-CoA-carboxylase] ligase
VNLPLIQPEGPGGHAALSAELPLHPQVCAPLLDSLLQRREPATVEALAERLGLPPSVVMKELSRLRAGGCSIESHPSGGVMLEQAPLPVWLDYLRWSCGANPRRVIEVYRRVGSTQDVVRRIVESYGWAADGAVAVAEEQTTGRGRLGRAWVAPAGTGAIFSMAHRVPASPAGQGSIDRLTLVAAVAVARAIETVAGDARILRILRNPQNPRIPQTPVTIKWPNDLLIRGQKVAGILVEAFQTPAMPGGVAAVIGVGINVALRPEHLPAGAAPWRGRFTSLALQGVHVERLRVIAAAVRELDRALTQQDATSLLNEWRRRCPMLGGRVRVQTNGQTLDGQVIDIDPLAGLILRTDRGQIVHLPAEASTVL